jgi:hypothetical protein
VSYLLEVLQGIAQERGQRVDCEAMLRELIKDLEKRTKTGKW